MDRQFDRYGNASQAVLAGAGVAACYPIGGFGAAVCAAAAATMGAYFVDQVRWAALLGVCLQIKYYALLPMKVVGFNTCPVRRGGNGGGSW